MGGVSSRRSFLVSTAAAVAGAGCGPSESGVRPVDGPAPTGDTGQALAPGSGDTGAGWTEEPGPEPPVTWQPPGTVDEETFAYGVQTGDATATSVVVSVRQFRDEAVTLVLAQGTAEGWEPVLELPGLLADDGVVQIELGSLIPDTTYAVVAYRPEGLQRSTPSRFRTALYPGQQRVVRLGAISCLGSAGAPFACLSQAAAQQLDAFLFLGDTIYADEGLRPASDWEGHWSDALQTAGMRDLTSSTSVVATWDDHEVDNNWSWDDAGMPETALVGLRAFRRAIPQRRGPGGTGVWRRLTWGTTLELFVLDCRGERANGDYVSRAQLDWLKAGLVESEARFKLILNSVPITDMDSVYLGLGADDRWDGHPGPRAEILRHITSQGVRGVLWVSGDFHWGALARVGAEPGDDGYDQREVFTGPGGSTINPLAYLVGEGGQYEAVVTERNYVRIEADPEAGTLTLAFVSGAGEVVAERVVAD